MLALLQVATIIVGFCLSPFALQAIGFNYMEEGGAFYTRIHPGTYVIAVTLLARLCQGGFGRSVTAAILGYPGALALAWVLAALVAYDLFFLRTPLTALIDTFFYPVAALLVFDRIPERQAHRLSRLIHAIFAANAVLALAEAAGKWHLTPIVLQGVVVPDSRSTALFGHPLENALLTGVYLVTLARGGGRDIPPALRLALAALQVAAMIPMGGRAASVATLAVLTVLGVQGAAKLLLGRRFSVKAAAVAALSIPCLLIVVAIAYDRGFFNALLERFASDNGSTQTRIVMFDLFSHFSSFELLFGPDQKLLDSLMWSEGTEYGIESFPIAMALTYGIIPTALLLIGLSVFVVEVVLRTRGAAAWPLCLFFLVAVTSLSIGAKTTIFGLIVTMMIVLLRPPRPEGVRALFGESDHHEGPAELERSRA